MKQNLNGALTAIGRRSVALLACYALLGFTAQAYAQGVTTGSINGTVVDAQKQELQSPR